MKFEYLKLKPFGVQTSSNIDVAEKKGIFTEATTSLAAFRWIQLLFSDVRGHSITTWT